MRDAVQVSTALTKLIRQIMVEQGLGQNTLASLCQIPKTTLSNYMNGVSPYPVELPGKLAHRFPAYRAALDEALYGSGSVQGSIASNSFAAQQPTPETLH